MIKKLQALKAKKGFTLVELIVVIAIIGVLAAILVPTLMGQVTKSKQSSLDSTASSVVTTVNTWVADRYTHGKSGIAPGKYSYKPGAATNPVAVTTAAAPTIVGGIVSTTTTTTTDWGLNAADGDNNTSLQFALEDAINFANNDYVVFWVDNSGKAIAAAYAQEDVLGGASSGVTYNASAKTWGGVGFSNEKDGIVNLLVDGNATGAMVGTNPKFSGTTTTTTPTE